MTVLVERMLSHHLDCFQDLPVCEHIPHIYSHLTAQRSQAVNLGVVDEHPSSTAGVTAIMKWLQKYCPTDHDGMVKVACHGDGLSVERMLDCQKHNSCAETSHDRLAGLLPVPQDFHKRLILLQVNLRLNAILS